MFKESQALYDNAVAIPGRSCTRSKAPGRFFDLGRGPLYAESARGAIIRDVDGNSYVDMLCALGAISIGYEGQPDGAYGVYSLPHRHEVDAAQAVLRHVAPWASRVRFLKTGSEALHAAYRIAKVATGRDVVLFARSSYHGWHEWCATEPLKIGPGDRTVSACAMRYPYGVDWASIDGLVGPIIPRGRVAAIFVEPPRWVPTSTEWLLAAQDFARSLGALFVVDEMIYGGRWALGGACEKYGIVPDLACYGKAIGNGAAVACIVGGNALAEHGEIASGTYSGEAGSLRQLLRTIYRYQSNGIIAQLWHLGDMLEDGLEIAIAPHASLVVREGAAVHQRLRFMKDDGQLRRGKEFAARMADRGVLWHPQCVNVMAAHTESQIEMVGILAGEILAEMAKEGLLD